MRFRQALVVALLVIPLLVLTCGMPEPAPTPVPLTATPALSATASLPSAPSPSSTSTPSPTDTPAPTDTPLPTHTAPPDDLNVSVPLGHAPTIDGILSPDEWTGALQDSLSDGGQLYLLHNRAYLYLGIRASAHGTGVASICLDRGDQVAVLHSSAALGTALYQQDTAGWQQIQPFSWRCRSTAHSTAAQEERQKFLAQERWLANNGNMGVPEEIEYQIALGQGDLRLAVTHLGPPNFNSVAAWPSKLRDDCRNIQLITGPIPNRLRFAPETWITLHLADTPTPP